MPSRPSELNASALALVALAVLAAPAAAVVASSVAEEVDIAALGAQRTIVSFALAPADAASLADADLAARCAAVAASGSCRPSRGAGGLVAFELRREPSFGLEELSWGSGAAAGEVRVRLSFEHRALQFPLAPGLVAQRRNLTIRFPTYRAVLADPRDLPTLSTFLVAGPGSPLAMPSQLAEAARSLAIGDALPIPRLAGSLCIAAIVQRGQARPAVAAVSPGCAPFALPTTGLLAAEGMELALVSLDLGSGSPRISSASTPISGSSQDLVVVVRTSGPVATGPAIDADVAVEGAVDGCEVSLLDMAGEQLERLDLSSCGRVSMSTARLSEGRYLIRARATRGSLSGVGTAAVTFSPGGLAAVGLSTEKDVYSPGEAVSVFPEGEGDVCELTLVDASGAAVERSTSGGCAPTQVPLGGGLAPGTYELRADVYQGGAIVASGVKTLEVASWSPRQEAGLSSLCSGGSLAVLDSSIPCIGPRMTCQPTSLAIPLCLCFDGQGAPRDVCRYQESCSPAEGAEGGCVAPKGSGSPFTVVRERGRCTAKRGLENLACIEVGEICSGTCMCLDPADRPLSPCNAGQLCSLGGCHDPAFVLEVKEFSPAHVRSDAMGDGVRLTWRGPVKVGERLDDRRVNEGLKASAFLGGTGAASTESAFDPSAGEWTFTPTFTHALLPGRYDAFLMLAVGEEQLLVRRPFEVWHPLSESELGMSVLSAAPSRLSMAHVEQGSTVRLSVSITDAAGAPVPYLPASALSASASDSGSGVKADVTAAEFDAHTGVWTVVVQLRGRGPTSDHLALAANHLGRTGQASTPLAVLERVPLAMRLLRVEPGTQDAPLFLLLVGLGFDMDVLMELEGGEHISKESFSVRVGGHDVSGAVSYAYQTSEGLRLHLSGVRLCPLPQGATTLDVEVAVRDASTGDSASDSARIAVSGNPGNWRGFEEVMC